jgi:hypothetical protein
MIVRLLDQDWHRFEIDRQYLPRGLTSRRKQSKAHERSRVPLTQILRLEGGCLKDNGTKIHASNKQIGVIDKLPATNVAHRVQNLYLSGNELVTLHGVETFPNLKVLSLTENFVRHFSGIHSLNRLPHLEMLSLYNNPVVNMPFYREYVLTLCPKLARLDNVGVTGNERLRLKQWTGKAEVYYSTMRLNELRICVLNHMRLLRKVFEEMEKYIVGRFRIFRREYISGITGSGRQRQTGSEFYCIHDGSFRGADDVEDIGVDRALAGHVLHVCFRSGLFRWLQIAAVEDFDRRVQEICFFAYETSKFKLRQANTAKQLPTKTLDEIDSTPEAKLVFWGLVCDEVIGYQQRRLISLTSDCEMELRSKLSGGECPHSQTGGILSLIQCFNFESQTMDARERRDLYVCGIIPDTCLSETAWRVEHGEVPPPPPASRIIRSAKSSSHGDVSKSSQTVHSKAKIKSAPGDEKGYELGNRSDSDEDGDMKAGKSANSRYDTLLRGMRVAHTERDIGISRGKASDVSVPGRQKSAVTTRTASQNLPPQQQEPTSTFSTPVRISSQDQGLATHTKSRTVNPIS